LLEIALIVERERFADAVIHLARHLRRGAEAGTIGIFGVFGGAAI
jgi:hypothetical protein